MTNEPSTRIQQFLQNLRVEFGEAIADLLRTTNRQRLGGKGKLTALAKIERNSVRWTLQWTEGPVHFDLNVVATVEDDGRQARLARVWVQRHAATPLDYEGHTPTTHMHRLTSLSLAEICQAIDAEWGGQRISNK